MLNNDDRRAIAGLFDRLKDVEHKAPPRDPDAEAMIRDEIRSQPGAPYYMAQTILVQEQALKLAEQRIRELEAEVERGSRDDVFGGLFGGGRREVGRREVNRRDERYEPEVQRGGPWDRNYGGGGFLAGAAQTALGVTGGILLGNAIASMFGAGAAQAAEPSQAQDQGADQNADSGNDGEAGNDDLGGGDFGGGDGGGFDTGGGFDFGGDF
jgi:hypothetical protein